MRLVFTEIGWSTYAEWATRDRSVLARVNKLITETLRDLYEGIGKPEPLRHQLRGAWSRRITQEHRLVYQVDGDELVILHVGSHYD